jgi:hypothetical protein
MSLFKIAVLAIVSAILIFGLWMLRYDVQAAGADFLMPSSRTGGPALFTGARQGDAPKSFRDEKFKLRRYLRLLPFAPVDWVDIVDAAPIPLAFDPRAPRHRQMVEESRQGAFRTVHSQ